MTVYLLIRIFNTIANIFIICVIVDSALSYFVSPYNPLRSLLDKIVQPLLKPIRRIVPLVGNLDLSPLVLIILIEVVVFLVSQSLHIL